MASCRRNRESPGPATSGSSILAAHLRLFRFRARADPEFLQSTTREERAKIRPILTCQLDNLSQPMHPRNPAQFQEKGRT